MRLCELLGIVGPVVAVYSGGPVDRIELVLRCGSHCRWFTHAVSKKEFMAVYGSERNQVIVSAVFQGRSVRVEGNVESVCSSVRELSRRLWRIETRFRSGGCP